MSDQSSLHEPSSSSVDYRTVVGDGLGAHVGYAELEALFDMHFDTIRRAQCSVSQPGLLTLAFDVGTASLAGKCWVKSRQDAISSMVVGRHRNCGLLLT